MAWEVNIMNGINQMWRNQFYFSIANLMEELGIGITNKWCDSICTMEITMFETLLIERSNAAWSYLTDKYHNRTKSPMWIWKIRFEGMKDIWNDRFSYEIDQKNKKYILKFTTEYNCQTKPCVTDKTITFTTVIYWMGETK